jgi:hypothetical protein
MKKIALYIVVLIVFAAMPGASFAYKMQSQEYELTNQEIEFETNEQPVVINADISPFTPVEKASFERNGYISFEPKSDLFTVKVTKGTLTFSELQPNRPLTASTTIQIQEQTVNGYQISIFQEKPLSTFSGNFLKNTSCDSPCTAYSASKWSSNSTYGIGYTATGNVSEDFKNGTNYRPFAISTKNELPALIAANSTDTKDEVQLTVKMNSDSKINQVYTGEMTVIVIPSY